MTHDLCERKKGDVDPNRCARGSGGLGPKAATAYERPGPVAACSSSCGPAAEPQKQRGWYWAPTGAYGPEKPRPAQLKKGTGGNRIRSEPKRKREWTGIGVRRRTVEYTLLLYKEI